MSRVVRGADLTLEPLVELRLPRSGTEDHQPAPAKKSAVGTNAAGGIGRPLPSGRRM